MILELFWGECTASQNSLTKINIKTGMVYFPVCRDLNYGKYRVIRVELCDD